MTRAKAKGQTGRNRAKTAKGRSSSASTDGGGAG